jgi:hypothetical protein
LANYHFLDESGDPGLSGSKSSSDFFVIAMVEMTKREHIQELAAVKTRFFLPEPFEFKYHTTKERQKEAFFDSINSLQYYVRVAAIDKSSIPDEFTLLNGPAFVIELISRLILRTPMHKLNNHILVLDDVNSSFVRDLRVKLSEECDKANRRRPFKKIASAHSHFEDGIQLADMIAGATRQHIAGMSNKYFCTFENRILDFLKLP